MRTKLERHIPFPAALAGALFLLAAGGLIALFYTPGGAEGDAILARRDGWVVAAGAPDMRGEPVFLSRDELLRGTLMLVSPDHPLPEDFPTPSTRAVRAMVGSYLPAEEGVALRDDMIYALCLMQFDHPLENGITIQRGTLSVAQQDQLRLDAFQRYSRVYPLQEALARSRQAVPGGGESEHQTGYAADIALTPPLSMAESDPLRRNETGKWLDENLWRYGFLRRYAPGSGAEGGCEDIHLRYVGTVHAAALHTLSLDLEAYLSLLHGKGALTLYREETPYAYFYCLPCEDDARILVPRGAEYQCSADNTGWAVIVIAARDAN